MALLNNKGEEVKNYTLYGCYANSTGEASYDLQGTGAIVTLPASFAYQYFRTEISTIRGSLDARVNIPGVGDIAGTFQ